MRFRVVVSVMPIEGISDPQGMAVQRALPGLGFPGFSEVRVGKRIELIAEAPNEKEADELLHRACREFLTNPVIEDYGFELRAVEDA